MRLSRIRAAVAGVALSKRVAVSRLCRTLLATVVALGVAVPSASALPDKKLEDLLGDLWVTVFETPNPENLFNPSAEDADPCVDLGGVIAPFGPLVITEITCTVKPGTKIFVIAWTIECSTTELKDPEASEEDLRECAHEMADNAGFGNATVTLDGEPVPLREVETGPRTYVLPADNVFGEQDPARLSGQLVGVGSVALLHPLTPGTHTTTIDLEGDGNIDNRTTIRVEPRT